MVAEDRGVGERLEGEGRLGPGDGPVVGDPPEGEDQVVVPDLLVFPVRLDADHPAVNVHAGDRRLDDAGRAEGGPDRYGAVVQPERAGRHVEQERGHQEGVFPADENDLDAGRAAEQPLQVPGGEDPAEPAAENHDSRPPGRH